MSHGGAGMPAKKARGAEGERKKERAHEAKAAEEAGDGKGKYPP